MAATNILASKYNNVKALQKSLVTGSVLSKQFILDRGLVAAVIDDNFLYKDEGKALICAFQRLGARAIKWCKTSDILNQSESTSTHVVEPTYESFESKYLEFDESIQFWNRILFADNLDAFVLHTAHDHIIYIGPKIFVNEATQRDNVYRNGWLSVIGHAFSDPELIVEYGLMEKDTL